MWIPLAEFLITLIHMISFHGASCEGHGWPPQGCKQQRKCTNHRSAPRQL
jgi:hypothetical protein